MKDVWISLLLFALVLTGVGWNAAYVGGVSEQLEAFVQDLSEPTESAVLALADYWEGARARLIWTVKHQELQHISETVLSLQAAYECRDPVSFERYRALLGELGAELSHAESLPFIRS